jgi:hypothetical protein
MPRYQFFATTTECCVVLPLQGSRVPVTVRSVVMSVRQASGKTPRPLFQSTCVQPQISTPTDNRAQVPYRKKALQSSSCATIS